MLNSESEDRNFTGRLYKAVRLNEEAASNRIYLPLSATESQFSGLSGTTESKTIDEVASGNNRSHERFFEFVELVKRLYIDIDAYFNQIKKNLNFKCSKIMSPEELVVYYEKLAAKYQLTSKHMRKNWNEDETHLLVSLVCYYTLIKDEDYNNLSEETWDFMGAIYPGKSSHRLKQRWQNIFKVTLSKIPWASTEDQLLVDIVQEKNYQRNWKEIALDLYSRSGLGIYRQGRQCRERWINHLDPSINRGYWTTEEDISLLKSYLELGRKWAEIAKRLRNRTENLVKNRWKTLMRRFKSLVCLDNLSSVSSHELDRGEKLERLIAQAVLHCYQKGTLITVPTKSETNQGALQYSPTKLSRSQSSLTHNSQDIAEDLSMKNDFPEFLALEEKKADLKSCIKPPQNRSRRKNMNQSDDNLLKNLCSGELVDRPVRFLDQSRESPGLKKFPSQNRSMHLSNSPFTPQLGESFSTISNWNTDNNTSYNTFKNDGLNGTFDCSYFSGEKPYGLNSGHTNYSFNSERMAFTKSKEDNQVILEEESFGCDDNLEIQMKGNNDITPQKGFISLSTANESNNTPFTLFRRNMQQDEGNPDAFINDDHLTKSECDMLDFFESEIDSISECGLNRTNNINDLTFCSKPGIGTREKSERDPNEFLCPDIDFGNPIRSDFAKPNNNRLVRRNSLDLLLEASDIMDGQETDDREMNLHLKGFSEFKAEERFNNQSGNSLFFAVVDTSKNELFLIDPVTKENFKPTVDTIKLRKQT